MNRSCGVFIWLLTGGCLLFRAANKCRTLLNGDLYVHGNVIDKYLSNKTKFSKDNQQVWILLRANVFTNAFQSSRYWNKESLISSYSIDCFKWKAGFQLEKTEIFSKSKIVSFKLVENSSLKDFLDRRTSVYSSHRPI